MYVLCTVLYKLPITEFEKYNSIKPRKLNVIYNRTSDVDQLCVCVCVYFILFELNE